MNFVLYAAAFLVLVLVNDCQCCTSIPGPAVPTTPPPICSSVCDPDVLRSYDADLFVTSPLGPEQCVEAESRASIICDLNILTVIMTGGGTTELTGSQNTIVVQCSSDGTWSTMTGIPITDINCASCSDACQTSLLDGAGLTVTSLASTGQCVEEGDSQASVTCDQTELVISIAGGTPVTVTGSPNSIVFGCNADGTWRTSTGAGITGLTCQACAGVCDPGVLSGYDTDLSVTSPLGTEECVEADSRASVVCDLFQLTVTVTGGATTILSGSSNTIVAQCNADGTWRSMDDTEITGIDCAPCTDVCQTNTLDGAGITVTSLASTGQCIEEGDNQATVLCDQTELVISLIDSTSITNTGSPNSVLVGCNADGTWRASTGVTINGVTCQACTDVCNIGVLEGTSLTVVSLVDADECILAGANQATVQCDLDTLTITTSLGATMDLDAPVTFLPGCDADGTWRNNDNIEIMSLACTACTDLCDLAFLEALSAVDQFSATLVGTGACIRESTQAVLICELADLVFGDAGGVDIVRYTGGTTANPVSHNVECVGGTWQFDGQDVQTVKCVVSGAAHPRPAHTASQVPDDSEIRLPSSVPAVPCIEACGTHGESFLSGDRPTFVDSNIHPGCADLRQAEEGNTLKATCSGFATIQFIGGPQFERDSFESEVELICTQKGWVYIDIELAIEEYLSINGDRKMECI